MGQLSDMAYEKNNSFRFQSTNLSAAKGNAIKGGCHNGGN